LSLVTAEILRLTDYRHERRDDEGRYAGVRRETLLNGVRISVCFITALLLHSVPCGMGAVKQHCGLSNPCL